MYIHYCPLNLNDGDGDRCAQLHNHNNARGYVNEDLHFRDCDMVSSVLIWTQPNLRVLCSTRYSGKSIMIAFGECLLQVVFFLRWGKSRQWRYIRTEKRLQSHMRSFSLQRMAHSLPYVKYHFCRHPMKTTAAHGKFRSRK